MGNKPKYSDQEIMFVCGAYEIWSRKIAENKIDEANEVLSSYKGDAYTYNVFGYTNNVEYSDKCFDEIFNSLKIKRAVCC